MPCQQVKLNETDHQETAFRTPLDSMSTSGAAFGLTTHLQLLYVNHKMRSLRILPFAVVYLWWYIDILQESRRSRKAWGDIEQIKEASFLSKMKNVSSLSLRFPTWDILSLRMVRNRSKEDCGHRGLGSTPTSSLMFALLGASQLLHRKYINHFFWDGSLFDKSLPKVISLKRNQRTGIQCTECQVSFDKLKTALPPQTFFWLCQTFVAFWSHHDVDFALEQLRKDEKQWLMTDDSRVLNELRRLPHNRPRAFSCHSCPVEMLHGRFNL
jgi:hypothetical protein